MSISVREVAENPAEGFCGLIGCHPSMLALFERLQRAATHCAPVLIVGETGVGKELVAQALHRLSGARGPIVPLNVALLSEHLADAELFGTVRGAFTGAVDRPGLVEAAAGGTLFLDEASELSLETQVRLLRALESHTVRRLGARQEHHVRFRLLLSLQQPAAFLVARGRWREDFCHRVNGITLHVPALRARLEDLPRLVNHTLCRFGRMPIPAESLQGLRAHAWPGNVRELIRLVERAIFTVGDGPLTGEALEAELETGTTGGPLSKAGARAQPADRAYLEGVLREAGSTKAAAEALNLTIYQVYRRLKALGITPPRRR